MNKCLCLSSCLLLVVAAFSAPRENGKNMATSDGSQSKLQYVLGPGDQVAIHVVDLDDVSDKPLRIDPTGFLDFPLIGRVSASGITLE